MTSRSECAARAELCDRLAKLEPSSRRVWLAEAKRWSQLAREAVAVTNVVAISRNDSAFTPAAARGDGSVDPGRPEHGSRDDQTP